MWDCWLKRQMQLQLEGLLPIVFPQKTWPAYISRCKRVPLFQHPCQHLISVFLIYCQSNVWKWYHPLAFICISLKTGETEHLFKCLPFIFPFFVNRLFIVFVHFSILFVFFLNTYKSKSFARYITMFSPSVSIEF